MRDTSAKPVEVGYPIFRIEWQGSFQGRGVIHDKDGPRKFTLREDARLFLDNNMNRLRRGDEKMTFRVYTINTKAEDDQFLSQINREQTS